MKPARVRSPHRVGVPLLIGLGALAALAGDAESPLISIETLNAPPDVPTVQISPEGERLALMRRVEQGFAIVLTDQRASRERTLTAPSPRGFDQLRWSSDGRYLLYLADNGGDEGCHLFRLDTAVTSDALSSPIDLTPFKGVQVELLAAPLLAPSAVIVTMNRRDPERPDAYRLNVATGELTELARNVAIDSIGTITQFLPDSAGAIHLALAIRDDGSRIILHRADQHASWQPVRRFAPTEKVSLLAMTTATRVWLRTNAGAAFERFALLDLTSGSFVAEKNGGCRGFDAGNLLLDDHGNIIGETCAADGARILLRDSAAAAALSKSPLAAKSLEIESASRQSRHIVIYASAADDAGSYWLLNLQTGTLKKLYDLKLALRGVALRPARAIRVQARDGLSLLSYLTLPASAPPSGGYPAVLLVHGGPWDRDRDVFSSEVQLLANRGYAVLQVNFRGSTGLGRRVAESAIGEFGGRMSDDLLDVLDWTIAKGYINAKRVCITGGSYGGFATLVGLTRDANRFACGVSFAGPADLVTLVESFPPPWKPYLPASWYRYVGNPANATDRTNMAQRSPINHLDSVRAPLLLFQGANDPRVTQPQADQIAAAFRQRGVSVTYMLAAREGHSFGEALTGQAVMRQTELFLAEHLGGRTQPQIADDIERTRRELLDHPGAR